MVVGSSTAFAGVFTYHADGFVVVFFHTRGVVVLVFWVKAITAHNLTLFGDFETAFGFDLSAVGTSEFHFDFGGSDGKESRMVDGVETGLATTTGGTLKLTFFFVEPFSAFVFSAVAFEGRRTAGEAVGLDGLKVAFVVGVDTAFHTAVVVFVANNNRASLSVVS